MMGIAVLVLVVLLAVAFLPQMWVSSVLRRHQAERAEFPGTGGEFARHILDEMKLGHVKVEETDLGDHYDPGDKAVRLSKPHFSGKSLAAVVVAAHEVGHAMQDATGYPPLAARTRLAKSTASLEKVGVVVMLAAPVLMVLGKSPVFLLMSAAAGAVIMLMSVAIHAVTLPVEFDASFRRALPVLKTGHYVNSKDLASARQILLAAAFTYVAAAAMSLLNVARWLRVLRM
ncbi:MAG: zinc metallopeptidase [Hyphomicrobiaceae bacterium]|nr:MAG: zinc metallopeptidase [Hyphomicrobiaceae bacterium]